MWVGYAHLVLRSPVTREVLHAELETPMARAHESMSKAFAIDSISLTVCDRKYQVSVERVLPTVGPG